MSAAEILFQSDPFVAQIHVSRQRACSYLYSRQSPAGGFCFYRTEYLDEPNLSDTWHAVAALRLLGEQPQQSESIANFVYRHPAGRQLYALYYRTFILDALGIADPERPAVMESVHALHPDPDGLTSHSDMTGQLERLLLTLRLKVHLDMEFAAEDIATAILDLEHPYGGFGVPPNILETYLAVDVLALCGKKASANTGTFVARLAGPGYGFRLTDTSLAFNLEAICAGIECCRLLRQRVAYPDDAAASILACQTGNGGFARAPDSLPGIETTHLALRGLASLFGNAVFRNSITTP